MGRGGALAWRKGVRHIKVVYSEVASHRRGAARRALPALPSSPNARDLTPDKQPSGSPVAKARCTDRPCARWRRVARRGRARPPACRWCRPRSWPCVGHRPPQRRCHVHRSPVRIVTEQSRDAGATRADLVLYGGDWTVCAEAKVFVAEGEKQLDRLYELWAGPCSTSPRGTRRGTRWGEAHRVALER